MAAPQMNFVGELLTKCQLAHVAHPEYDDESTKNVFKFSCKLQGWVCHGTGTSKKFAKQNAAKEMLDLIRNGNLSLDSCEENFSNSDKSYVSKLNEFCSKKKKGTPLFSEIPKEDELFRCKCSLDDFSAEGRGTSKKQAKEKAAFKVAQHFEVDKYLDNLTNSKERILANLPPTHELSTFCQKKHIDAPRYETSEFTENKVKKYKVIGYVGDLKKESCVSHSSKAAKCEVASLLLESLKSDITLASPAVENEEKPRLAIKRRISFDSIEEPVMEPLSKRSS